MLVGENSTARNDDAVVLSGQPGAIEVHGLPGAARVRKQNRPNAQGAVWLSSLLQLQYAGPA
jgi:hypothetical protein